MRYLIRAVRLLASPFLAIAMAVTFWWAYVEHVCEGRFDADENTKPANS